MTATIDAAGLTSPSIAADLEEFRRLTVVIARLRRHVVRDAAHRREIALRLRAAGVPLSVIAAAAGLSKSAIARLNPPTVEQDPAALGAGATLKAGETR